MTALTEIKQQIAKSFDHLSEESLREIMTFMEYLQYKQVSQASKNPPYIPVALGGLWRGITINDNDIAEIRQEMWHRFDEVEN